MDKPSHLRVLSEAISDLACAHRDLSAQHGKLARDINSLFIMFRRFGFDSDALAHALPKSDTLSVLLRDTNTACSIIQGVGTQSVAALFAASPAYHMSVHQIEPGCRSSFGKVPRPNATASGCEAEHLPSLSSSEEAGYSQLKPPGMLRHSRDSTDSVSGFCSCHNGSPMQDAPWAGPPAPKPAAPPACAEAVPEGAKLDAECEREIPLAEDFPRQGSPGSTCQNSGLTLLQEMWQHSKLADALWCAMGDAGIGKFCCTSRAAQETVRQSALWAPSGSTPKGCARQSALPEGAPGGPLRQEGARQAPSSNNSSPCVTVRLHSLQSKPELNGVLGTLLLHTERWPRCRVILAGGTGLRVRRSNLTVVTGRDSLSNQRLMQSDKEALSVAMQKGAIFIFGGCGPAGKASACSSSAHVLAPTARSWQPLPHMASARQSACSVAAAGRFYVLGGSGGLAPLRSVECFDPEAYAWQPAPPMLQARCSFGAAVLDGSLYACGGLGPSGQALGSAERLPLAGGPWRRLPPMRAQRERPDVVVVQGCMYVCGGCNIQDGIDTMVECFSPSHKQWTNGLTMPWKCYSAAVAAHAHYLYVCGGLQGGCSLSCAARFHHGSRTWERLPNMPSSRHGAIASASTCGDVFVCGGTCGQHMTSETTFKMTALECFRSESGIWETLQSMASPFKHEKLVVLGDAPYILGGMNPDKPCEAIEHSECVRLFVKDVDFRRITSQPDPCIGGAYTVIHPQV